MAKNLIICCDGTGNQYGCHNTNVVRLIENLIRDDKQQICYDPGVGTFNFLGKPRLRTLSKLLGKAFGYGLQSNIVDVYKFLMQHYQPDDKVYLFGFSRGAYTVRVLAGILNKCGVLDDGCYNLIPFMLKIYYQQNNTEIAKGFKATFSKDCKPVMIGVWDTVKSLGYFFGKRFVHADLNEDVLYAYQALAIDEKRKKFLPCLWNEANKSPKQIIEQVWFAGVHSDVGGGYPQHGLADITLLWMLEKASRLGVRLVKNWRQHLTPNPCGILHNSRTKFWRLWRPVTRKIVDHSLIHQSVIERMNEVANYSPQLPQHYTVVQHNRQIRVNKPLKEPAATDTE